MAVVAQGTLADRSAPRLFATLAGRAFTGELVIAAGGKDYRVAWEQGAVVGARSPHPADGAAKVAVTLGVLNSTQAGEVARLMLAAPGHDELDVVAQVARLGTELVERLARRIAGARATRALSPEAGTFTVLDELPYWGTVAPVDARWVLYNGLRSHLTLERVGRELTGLASMVKLRPDADITGFGFASNETVVLERLASGLRVAPLPDELDAQLSMAMALALVLTGEAEIVEGPVPATAKPEPAKPDRPDRIDATPKPELVTPRAVTAKPEPAKPDATPRPEVVVPTRAEPRPRPVRRAAAANADQIRALVAARLALLDKGADHFVLLDVPIDAPPETIRTRYFELARHLHPDRLAAAGIEDEKKQAQRLFARMNEAFTTLTDPEKRHKYTQIVRAGGEVAVKAREAATEAAVRRALEAEERFRLGEMALRRQQLEIAVREFQRALDLDPEESDHHAMLGWALYLAANNKASAVPIARGHLLRATEKNKKSALPYLQLGRIARLEGNDVEAEKQLRQALTLSPDHAEATAELRAVESRRGPAGKSPDKGGLFNRPKKP